MNSLTHKELVQLAYKWVLKRGGCGVAFKELYTYACNGEYPDVIGFSSGTSTVIECKKTVQDFVRDKKKTFRQYPDLGMGNYRYYCCPAGMISVEDLPEKWGLLYVDADRKIRRVHSSYGQRREDGFNVGFTANVKAEQQLMYSVLRRLFIKGHVKHIYDKKYNRDTTPDELIALNTYDPSLPSVDHL